ncbi:unnamed protein product, partial [Lymnaea stagnalis]
AIIQPPVYLLGLIANIINIIIYLKLKLKDSITMCFFVLSCSDLMCVLLLIVEDAAMMFKEILWERYQVDGKGLCWLMAFYYGSFYDISQGITTFIAVQKCWCVALPFRFKNTFTTRRTTVILTAISLMFFTLYIPIFASQGLPGEFDPATNKTLFKLWTSENRGVIFSAVGLVALVFTTTCQFTVIFCVIILASSLRASSKFRTSTTISSIEQISELKSKSTKCDNKRSKKFGIPDKMNLKNREPDSNEEIAETTQSDVITTRDADIKSAARPVKTTSSKELQAIKSTTFVAVLFVSCNTFKLLNYYVILCIPDYSLYGVYENTYLMTNTFRILAESLHVSCNMFVYLTFNTRFRSTLLSMFGVGLK